MNIGNQISAIRKEQQLTQEQFRSLFHVTRQTVSNWENEKSYPDLQMLIDISNQFEISLDTLIKEDSKMVKTIDKERVLGKIKKKNQSLIFYGCRNWNYCILPAFTRFHTPNCSNNYWTCNDWNWLV